MKRLGVEKIEDILKCFKDCLSKVKNLKDYAADILERQKDKGIDVPQLAKRLDDEFDVREFLLESVFVVSKIAKALNVSIGELIK